MKKISERLHCWKVLCENVFQIKSELGKRNYWWLAMWKVPQISQDWIKMLPVIKYYMKRLNSLKKIKFLYKSKTRAVGKSCVKNRVKNKIFFCTTASKFQEISTLNIYDGAKQIYPKKYKKCSKRRYSTNFNSSHLEVQCKKVPFIFKISPTVYLHVIKIDTM